MSTLLEQASLVMIPSGYKEDVVYSQIPTDGAGDLSFTRASNGTRTNSAGLVEVCPWNLVEQSETFDNVIWGKEFTTITVNNITAPNGTLTADRFTLGVGTEQKFVYQLANQNGSYTQSVYLKKGTHTFAQLAVGGDVNPYCNFDLTNGTFSAVGSTATMTNVGDEWYRCTMTYSTSIGTYVFIFATNSLSSARTAQTSSTGNFYAWGFQLNIGSTAKPYFPTTDRLNVARLTYQNGGGGCPSLLLEKQSTNLAQYSEQFDNAYWSKTNATISANNTTSPDGTQNADLIIADTTNGVHQFRTTISSVTAQNYTMSIFAKKSGINFIRFWEDGQTGKQCYFNLNTGVATNVDMTSVSIENIGNGWYRCIAVVPIPASGVFGFRVLVSQDGSATAYAGNGTDGIFVWGAQLEASSYPTSYIPTTSSSATRVADACSKTGISSLIGQTEGTLFVDINYLPHEAQSIFAIEDWVANSTVIRILSDTSTSLGAQVFQGGNQYTATFNTAVVGQRYKCALAYKANDFAFYVNGTQVSTSSSGTVPTTSNVRFGAFLSGQTMDGQINQAVLFKTRLTNAELASLTTI